MSAQTIFGVVEEAAARFSDAHAIEDGGTTLTFTELHSRGQQAVRAFIAAGIQKGDRVAIWAPNMHEWVIAAIGLQGAGAVLVPINTRFKGNEAGYVLEKSGARILLSVGEFLGNNYIQLLRDALGGPEGDRPIAGLPKLQRIVALASPTDGTQPLSEFLAAGDSVTPEAGKARAESVDPGDLSDLLFTSGTTGNPKGVMTSHAQNLRAFRSWANIVGLREGDRYLIVNPFFHAFGYKAGWLACLLQGATIIPHPVFDVPAVLRRIGSDKITMLPGPPALYQALLGHPELAAHDISSLRLAVTGAAVIPVELIVRMREELGFDTVLTAYGLTEMCGVVSMCRQDDPPEIIATTSGRAIDDVEMRAVDSENQPVAAGEPGEIVTRGYNVMLGYFDNEAETREAIDDEGWFHTGDIGVLDEQGNVRITDRKKDMFIMGGFNCYPAEIENLMLKNEDLVQVAVIGVEDPRMGEVGMAFVVSRTDTEVGAEALTAWCRKNMANYKVPRHIELVEALPMNATGKVTKFVLREQAKQLLSS